MRRSNLGWWGVMLQALLFYVVIAGFIVLIKTLVGGRISALFFFYSALGVGFYLVSRLASRSQKKTMMLVVAIYAIIIVWLIVVFGFWLVDLLFVLIGFLIARKAIHHLDQKKRRQANAIEPNVPSMLW